MAAIFLLEHKKDPVKVVEQMCFAVRPGGGIILLDDGHELTRIWPLNDALDHA